jgi:hypothetical protein
MCLPAEVVTSPALTGEDHERLSQGYAPFHVIVALPYPGAHLEFRIAGSGSATQRPRPPVYSCITT